MNNVSQFLFDTNYALTSNDDLKGERYINTDEFNAKEKFNDMWNAAHTEIAEKYSLPALHLWEYGFAQGDASNEELIETAKQINAVDWDKNVNIEVDIDYENDETIETNLFTFLDDKLLEILEPKAELLIEQYQAFCKELLDA